MCLVTRMLIEVSTTTPAMATLVELCAGLPLDPLPPPCSRDPSLSHAPVRTPHLTHDEKSVKHSLSHWYCGCYKLIF